MALVDKLIQKGYLKTPEIIEAFRQIKRLDFLPASMAEGNETLQELAELDEALPIGWGQTISQPLVVAFMLELLEPKGGEKILDIGSGSGWTTALLAYLVGQGGRVIAMEIIPELAEFSKANVAKYNFIKGGVVEVIRGDGSKGYPQEAPFDKILSSASALKIPQAWQEQVKPGGKIVSPIKESIWLLEKTSDSQFKKQEFPGFLFVPLQTTSR